MLNWYVFRVATGDEEKLKKRFYTELDDTIGFCFIPMVEISLKRQGIRITKLEPMFPGYIFVESEDIDRICKIADSRIKNCFGLRNCEGKMQSIEQHEIDFLMQFANDEYKVEMSHGIKENDKVTIASGPLVGFEGLIRKIDRHKRTASIEIKFMGEIRRVTVGLEVL